MSRDTLHQLIDRIPEEDLPAAHRFLQYLATSPAFRSAGLASLDDEPVTEADASAIAQAREDLRAGRVVRLDQVLREFGLR